MKEILTANKARVELVRELYGKGIKSENLSEDISPWVKVSLEGLEKGEPLNEDILSKIDISQNNKSAPNK